MDEILTTTNEEMNTTAPVDKHEKFKEQSLTYIKKAIIAIENVGKVSNQKNFEYSDEEVEKMFAALQETLDDTKHLFKKKEEFSW